MLIFDIFIFLKNICLCVLHFSIYYAVAHQLYSCRQEAVAIHGILQARILEKVAIPFSWGSSKSRDQTQVACIAGGFFTRWATREVAQLPPILCDAMDCKPPGSVLGILQARILEWVAISFSKRSSQPGFEPGSPAL